MAAQNSGGQRGRRQESGNDKNSKSPGGQRGIRQEPGNDNSTKNADEKNGGSGESSPGRKNNATEKSQKDLGG